MIPFLLKINTVEIPALKVYDHQPSKLTTDADRVLDGSLRFTYIGNFPKLFLEFRHTTQAEMALIRSLLDLPSFSCQWWDSSSQTHRTGDFYASDYKSGVFNKKRELYTPFSVNLVAFQKI